MNKTTVILDFVACMTAAGAAGFFIGRSSTTSGEDGTQVGISSVRANAPDENGRMFADSTQAHDADISTATRSFAIRLDDIAALDPGAKRACEAEVLFEALSAEEMPSAFEALMQVRRGTARTGLISAFFKHWGAIDPHAALETAKNMPTRDRPAAEFHALRAWAQQAPADAWAMAKELLSAIPAHSWSYTAVLGEMAKTDPARALAEAMSISRDSGRLGARHHIVSAAVETGSIETLLVAVQGLKSAADRESWTKEAFTCWAGVDVEAPLAVLASITDPALAKSAMTGLLTGWGGADPTGALEYAAAHHSDPLVSGALEPMLLRVISESSRAEADAFVGAIGESNAVGSLSESVLLTLANTHPELALKLAASNRMEDEREAVERR